MINIIEKENSVNEILEEFDFNRVHCVMEFLEWEWVDHDSGHYYKPSISKMTETCRRYLEFVWDRVDSEGKDSETTMSSGGFQVYACRFTENNEDFINVSLSFIIEKWENFY